MAAAARSSSSNATTASSSASTASLPPPVRSLLSELVRREPLSLPVCDDSRPAKSAVPGENSVLEKNEYWELGIPYRFRFRPMFTKEHLARYPERTISRPLSIVRAPLMYEIDALTDSNDVFAKNGRMTWYAKMYQMPLEEAWFEAPFPGDLLQCADTTRADVYIDLTFSLGREDLRIRDFLDQYSRGAGEIVMSIAREKLEAVLGKVVDFGRQDYHAIPLMIRVKSVHSTLPITMKCSFRSRVSKASPEEIKRQARIQEEARNQKTALSEDLRAFPNVEWTHPHATQHGTAGIVVMPRQKEMFSQQEDTVIYTANAAVVNNPDFPRWITVDFGALLTLFGSPCSYEGVECFRLHKPNDTDTKFALHFWFFVEHYPLIRHHTRRIFGVDKDQRLNVVVDGFIYTPCVVIQEITRRRMQSFNKDALLMSFDELQLVASPARGADGWTDLRNILNARSSFPNCVAEEDHFAQFSVTLTLAFEPYIPQRPTAGGAASSAAAASGAHAAMPIQLFDAASPFAAQAHTYFQNHPIRPAVSFSSSGSSAAPDSSSSIVLTPEQLSWVNMALAANGGRMPDQPPFGR
jgi:hypothetical protein